MDSPIPTLCAVSSPSRLATDADPIGGRVVTIVDDGRHGAITRRRRSSTSCWP